MASEQGERRRSPKKCRATGFTASGARWVCLSDASGGRTKCGYCDAHCECRCCGGDGAEGREASTRKWSPHEATTNLSKEKAEASNICAREGDNGAAGSMTLGATPPSLDCMPPSCHDWAGDDSERHSPIFWHQRDRVEPVKIWACIAGSDMGEPAGEGGDGVRNAEKESQWARKLRRRAWRSDDAAFCAYGRILDHRPGTDPPLIEIGDSGVVMNVDGRSRKVAALSSFFWTPWSCIRGENRMRVAATLRNLICRFIDLVNTGVVNLKESHEELSRWDILADSPLPWYSEYGAVTGMRRISVPSSLWWDDRNPNTNEPYGPAFQVQELLVPNSWQRSDFGADPASRSMTRTLGRGDRKGVATDPWECLVLSVPGVSMPVAARQVDLEWSEEPTIIIDQGALGCTRAVERGYVMVGQDAGTAVIHAKSNKVMAEAGLVRKCRTMRKCSIATLLDSMEVDDSIREGIQYGATVDPTREADAEWLTVREIVCAMNVDAFLLDATPETGSYAVVRGRERREGGRAILEPLPADLLVPMVIGVEIGGIREVVSGKRVEIEDGHVLA